jgi:predicted N-acetyltransferase YhbS
MKVTVRPVEKRDTAACGRICCEAFASISDRHGFPHDFPSVDVATDVMETRFADPGFYGVVAERDGAVIGSNWLDERNPIAGIGPITIDPAAQDGGAGRRLMEAAIERADERGFPGVRLVQAAYHARSLSLYTKLGFASREELAVMDGMPVDPSVDRYSVRSASVKDVPSCSDLCVAVHGALGHVGVSGSRRAWACCFRFATIRFFGGAWIAECASCLRSRSCRAASIKSRSDRTCPQSCTE